MGLLRAAGPLSEPEITAVIDAALRILARSGVRVEQPLLMHRHLASPLRI